MPNRRRFAIAIALMLSAGSTALADSIVAKGLTFNGRVVRIDGDKIVFRNEAGIESTRPLSDVTQMTIDDEPAFNAAETAATAGKPDPAIDGYRKTIGSTTKDWLRHRAAVRLADVAAQAKRFDAAAVAYATLVQADPKNAPAFKPAIPAKSSDTENVIRDVRRISDDRRTSSASRQLLLAFIAEMQQARGDTPAATRTAQQVMKNDPGTQTGIPAARISNARAALNKKDFATARSEIESAAPLLVSVEEQAEAMFLLAEAQAGLAQPSNPAAMKDAAIAYMRVVAHFKSAPGAPHVPQSLFGAAGVLDKLGEKEQARELYAEVVAQYPQSPVAADAKAAAQRLAQQAR